MHRSGRLRLLIVLAIACWVRDRWSPIDTNQLRPVQPPILGAKIPTLDDNFSSSVLDMPLYLHAPQGGNWTNIASPLANRGLLDTQFVGHCHLGAEVFDGL